MLSARTSVSRGDVETSSYAPEKFIPHEDYSNRKGRYHSTPYGEESFDCRRLLTLFLFIVTFALFILSLLSLAQPRNIFFSENDISNDVSKLDNRQSPDETRIIQQSLQSSKDSKNKILGISDKINEISNLVSSVQEQSQLHTNKNINIDKESKLLLTPETELNLKSKSVFHSRSELEPELETEPEPDSRGCYHKIIKFDSTPHIVEPPAGPVKLVCCQSTKGKNIYIMKYIE